MPAARAFWITGPEQGELRDEPLAAPRPDQVLVEALHGAVSRGTELLVWRGLVPESERTRMRAPHQAGEFPWPVKYGYCSVGRVRQGPAELLGGTVCCLHPHQDRYVVGVEDVVPVPEGVPAARAVLAPNMETALNGLWDAGLCAGDRVSVVGGGWVGLLAAYLAARHPGTEVSVVDVDARKAEVTALLGATFELPGHARGGADVVVHASGTAAGLSTALALAGPEATVLELSWYGTQPVTLSLGEAFHAQRLRLQSSQVGALPPARRPRWTRRRRLELALELLRDERLDVLVREAVPFSRLPEAMAQLARGDGAPFGPRVDY